MMICSGDGFSLEHSDGKEIWNLLGCWCSDVTSGSYGVSLEGH